MVTHFSIGKLFLVVRGGDSGDSVEIAQEFCHHLIEGGDKWGPTASAPASQHPETDAIFIRSALCWNGFQSATCSSDRPEGRQLRL